LSGTASSRSRFLDWLGRYEAAWRATGVDALRGLFAADATYRAAPFDEPIRGLDDIAAFWEAEREGPDEVFLLRASIIAAEVATAVARVEVHYGDPVTRAYRDLWIITLNDSDLCTMFEEWPFFPEQPRLAPQ
jgi:hypothetical protein